MIWYILIAASIIVPPVIAVAVVTALPPTYFIDPDARDWWGDRHPAVRAIARVAKNFLGLILLVIGAIMLVTPGQGLLMIVMGILLLDFPGKQKLELRLISKPWILKSLNRLRRRFGKTPLLAVREPMTPAPR